MRDLNEISEMSPEPYDICVIGSGPSGIVFSAELADTNLRICILESGGLRKTDYGDGLRKVVSNGIHIKDYSRERILGGASTTWSGLSSQLDEVDMSPREVLGVSGWPIGRQEMMPYWEAAASRYRFPKPSAFSEFERLRKGGQFQPQWNRIAEKIFLAAEPPQRFAQECKESLERKNVDFFYNATVLRLGGAGRGDAVEHAVAVSSDGKKHAIKARFFVLATGGIENARLLLSSTDIHQQGLGNEYDQVGRYFMNHPKNNFGIITLTKPIYDAPYFFGCLWNGYAGYAGLRLSENVQKELGILNSYIRLEPLFSWSNNAGVHSAIILVKKAKSLLNYWKQSRSGEVIPLRDYAETGDTSLQEKDKKSIREWFGIVMALFLNMGTIARYGYMRLSKKKPATRKISIRNFMEMQPHPENRVILSVLEGIHGERIPEVHHRPTDLDRRSLHKLHEILAQEIAANGLGDLEGKLTEKSDWPINQDASHHLGATRMGDDPRTSVVDRNLKLHTIENVYCAGGSVFPTSGCANPTFTICALSIRLAEHFKKNLFHENRISH